MAPVIGDNGGLEGLVYLLALFGFDVALCEALAGVLFDYLT